MATIAREIRRSCSVLAELCEAMSPEKLTEELVGEFKVATVQRLGYLLEDVLAERELADALFDVDLKRIGWKRTPFFRLAAMNAGNPSSRHKTIQRRT